MRRVSCAIRSHTPQTGRLFEGDGPPKEIYRNFVIAEQARPLLSTPSGLVRRQGKPISGKSAPD